MNAATAVSEHQSDLADRVVLAVRERTSGRLRDTRAAVRKGVVTVAATAPSFYLKQLAVEAARSVLGDLPLRLELEIRVHAR